MIRYEKVCIILSQCHEPFLMIYLDDCFSTALFFQPFQAIEEILCVNNLFTATYLRLCCVRYTTCLRFVLQVESSTNYPVGNQLHTPENLLTVKVCQSNSMLAMYNNTSIYFLSLLFLIYYFYSLLGLDIHSHKQQGVILNPYPPGYVLYQ